MADVDSLYSKRRQDLEAGPGMRDVGFGTATLQANLERLRQEESAVLELLLGPDPSTRQVDSTPRRFVKRQPDTIKMPLVFQNIDSAALKLSPNLLAAVQEVRQMFQDEMSHSGLAPDDPAYRALWLKAQAANDEFLMAMLGPEHYVDFEVAVRSAAAASEPTSN